MAKKQKQAPEGSADPVEDAAPQAVAPELALSNQLPEYVDNITAALDRVRAGSSEAFENYLVVGERFATLKGMFAEKGDKGSRAFNKWADGAVNAVTQQWRNRLIQLHTIWPEVATAVESGALPELADPATRTVDKVITAWRKHQKAANGGAEGEGEGEEKPLTAKSMAKGDLIEVVEGLAEVLNRYVMFVHYGNPHGVTADDLLADATPVLARCPWLAPKEEPKEEPEVDTDEPVPPPAPCVEPVEVAPEVDSSPELSDAIPEGFSLNKRERQRLTSRVRDYTAMVEAGDEEGKAAALARIGELAQPHGISAQALLDYALTQA